MDASSKRQIPLPAGPRFPLEETNDVASVVAIIILEGTKDPEYIPFMGGNLLNVVFSTGFLVLRCTNSINDKSWGQGKGTRHNHTWRKTQRTRSVSTHCIPITRLQVPL